MPQPGASVAPKTEEQLRAEMEELKDRPLSEFIDWLDREFPVPDEEAVPDLAERHDYYARQEHLDTTSEAERRR